MKKWDGENWISAQEPYSLTHRL